MCGIYGKLRFDGADPDPIEAGRLRDLLAHRGPDGAGLLVDGPLALGHRRLAIIDLSERGSQPMSTEDGALAIVFNGEIYNFRGLRAQLEARGHRFRSRSDTEIVLALYREAGERALESLRGMFAFAIWDRRKRSLFLARDRLGKKPLFYCLTSRFFAFASELRSLVEDPEIETSPDLYALRLYLTFQSVPHPRTAFRGIEKLAPGHWLEVAENGSRTARYWDLRFEPKLPAETGRQRDDLVESILAKLREAVRIRLVSDVPLGALLSGGLDSSAVVACMARETAPDRVRTFSVGFEEQEFDELPWARRVAREFETEHREIVLRPEMASVLTRLVECFGEPFADPAALPLFHVAAIARREVSVALCGDGGDENFAGYDRHRLLVALRRLPRFPTALARALARLVPAGGALPLWRRPLWIAHRLAATLALPVAVRNLSFFGHFDRQAVERVCTPEFLRAAQGPGPEEIVLERFRASDAEDPLDAVLYADVHTYLADTLLPKVDVAAMATSLEVRSPFLDHELMELAARIPSRLKVRGRTSKWIFRRAAERILPRGIVRRRKHGFGVPLECWLRGELREMTHDLLHSRRARERGHFRPEAVEQLVAEHESGRNSWSLGLYNLLVLELWYRRFVDR
jgi:asparagine synthase (glutamine-hydrolysing)